MKVENGKASGIRIAYIGGGSRAWAWTFMTDLAVEPSMSGEIALYDIDRPAAEKNKIIGERITADPRAVGKWDYRVADSLQNALTGADFVIISILPGTFEEMEHDVHMPERLGIWQSVGDTAGPGGMIRALRTIPMFTEIANAIKAYAPEAIVINYTNPMTLCMQELYRAYPDIKAFGCCHEVFSTQKLLAAAAEEMLGMENVSRDEVHVNVLGINHFTWFDEASCRGVDLMPVYRAFVDKHYEEGYEDPEKPWTASPFNCAHRVKFDLFRRYGLIAAAGDRHLAEFMPGDEYLKDPQTAASWKFRLTPVSHRKEDLKNRLARSARLVSGEEAIDLKPSGEEGIRLMRALCGLDCVVSNVNLPNYGQIGNLPRGVVVETNAVFSKGSILPVLAGDLPWKLQTLILEHLQSQKFIMDATRDGCKEDVVRAFKLDPNVAAHKLSEEEVRKLVDDMIAATKAYLPEGWYDR